MNGTKHYGKTAKTSFDTQLVLRSILAVVTSILAVVSSLIIVPFQFQVFLKGDDCENVSFAPCWTCEMHTIAGERLMNVHSNGGNTTRVYSGR